MPFENSINKGGGGNPWGNSKESSLGDLQGYIQQTLDASNPKNDIANIWTYFTHGLQPDQLDALTQKYYGQVQSNHGSLKWDKCMV